VFCGGTNTATTTNYPHSTLSKTSATEDDVMWSMLGGFNFLVNQVVSVIMSLQTSMDILLTTKTLYYLNTKQNTTATPFYIFNNYSHMRIVAKSNYL
jgi:hypothetical protein